MKPYDLLPDGTIHIHPEQRADLKRLFARAGIDIQSVKTEADFTTAHSAAGEVLFGILINAAENGDKTSRKALQQFADGDLSNFKATIARATFKAV
jgi:hypothetical protein